MFVKWEKVTRCWFHRFPSRRRQGTRDSSLKSSKSFEKKKLAKVGAIRIDGKKFIQRIFIYKTLQNCNEIGPSKNSWTRVMKNRITLDNNVRTIVMVKAKKSSTVCGEARMDIKEVNTMYLVGSCIMGRCRLAKRSIRISAISNWQH